MRLRFKRHLSLENCLDEAAKIEYNDGANYGQVVFMAGGAGSGKGFSLANFMDQHKFKVFDIDELKTAFIKMAEIQRKGGKYTTKDGDEKETRQRPQADFSGFDAEDDPNFLKKGKNVSKVHQALYDKGSSEAKKDTLFRALEGQQKEKLPNLIFDITLRHMKHVDKAIPILRELGYDTKNIHLSWVLADYSVALEQNKQRDRRVADDIVLDSHEGAAENMFDIIHDNLPDGLDGEVRVILSGKENNEAIKVVDKSTGEDIKGDDGKPLTIMGIPTIKLKDSGQHMRSPEDVTKRLYRWIRRSIPNTSRTKHIHQHIQTGLQNMGDHPCPTPEKKARDGKRCGDRASSRIRNSRRKILDTKRGVKKVKGAK